MVLDLISASCIGWPNPACVIRSFDTARVVQGERRAELARALLSRSPHSQKHLHCFCKVTKNFWNFQIVSRKNCTFGDKNCTFESFLCFLGECRSTKVLKAFSLPRLQSPFYRFSVTRYRLQFFYEPIIRRDAWKIAKYVSKNIYYYIYNIYIYYI